MTITEIYALPVDQYGWRKLPTGDGVTLGNYVKLGNYVTLGNGVKLKWSPLQIQGSRHLLYVGGPDVIGIGCMRHDASWWLEHYKATGRAEGYSLEQVEEYKQWIDVAIEWQSKQKWELAQ